MNGCKSLLLVLFHALLLALFHALLLALFHALLVAFFIVGKLLMGKRFGFCQLHLIDRR